MNPGGRFHHKEPNQLTYAQFAHPHYVLFTLVPVSYIVSQVTRRNLRALKNQFIQRNKQHMNCAELVQILNVKKT